MVSNPPLQYLTNQFLSRNASANKKKLIFFCRQTIKIIFQLSKKNKYLKIKYLTNIN
jgi:hypothetical protein